MVETIAYSSPRIAVVYLCRALDEQALLKCAHFIGSYKRHTPGIDHDLFVILKGIESATHLSRYRSVLASIRYEAILMEDEHFDLGSYFAAAAKLDHELICFFNTSSEILADDWLLKLVRNLECGNVGMAGATGSFETGAKFDDDRVTFPNVHLRTNAFIIRRSDFLTAKSNGPFNSKQKMYELEHGPNSLTQQIIQKGQTALVVGRNGRGYAPAFWPISGTFRIDDQRNLLVRDNQTEAFYISPYPTKRHLSSNAWGAGDIAQELRYLDTTIGPTAGENS